MTTPPSLSALVECKRLIDAWDAERETLKAMRNFTFDESDRQINRIHDARDEANRACLAYVRSLPTATQSGLCHDCENKKLREVLSAPRPDVSLGELVAACKRLLAYADELNANARADGYGGGNTFAKQIERELREPIACCESALRAQSPAEGGWLPIESAPNHKDILIHRDNGEIELIGADENDYKWRPYDAKRPGVSRPTHWQPLPKPPTAIALRESQAEGKS